MSCFFLTYSVGLLPHTALTVFRKDGITTSYLKLNIHSIKTVLSIIVYLTFDDYNMTVMICLRNDNSPSADWLWWLFGVSLFLFCVRMSCWIERLLTLVAIMVSDAGRVDMHAVYLQSVRSPCQRGAVLSDVRRYRHCHSFNSPLADSDDQDDDYVEDSFCVDDSQGRSFIHSFVY